MTLINVVRQFFDTPAGAAVVVLFALGALDLLLGLFAAWRDKVFQWEAVDAWVRSQVAGRILPITAVLLVGHMLGGISFSIDDLSDLLAPGPIITGIGLGAAAVYIAARVASIRESLEEKRGIREVPQE